MALPFASLIATIARTDVLSTLLSVATTLGLDVTAWQPLQPGRTMLATVSQKVADLTATISLAVQGGFLDYAATGTVTYTDANGNVITVPVTPEGGPGWLDVLASSVYNVSNGAGGTGRIAATYAGGPLTFTNTSGSSYGPYAAGTFHVACSATGKTYTNTSALTIGTGTTSGQGFAADVAGAASTASPGQIDTLVTPLLGVSVTNPASLTGADAEKNVALAARCRSKLASISPNGPGAAYDYFARTMLISLSPLSPVTRSKGVINTATGTRTTYVASANGAVPGAAQIAITGATNANPTVLQVSSTSAMTTGMTAIVSGVGGNTGANGTWVLTVVDGSHVSIPVDTSSGSAYTNGGMLEAGDLGIIDANIQAWCVPDVVSAVTASATANNIHIQATIYLKKLSVLSTSQAQTLALNALAAYFPNLPLGGNNIGSGAKFFLQPMAAVMRDSHPDIIDVVITSPGADVTAASSDVATLTSVASDFTIAKEM